MLPDPAADVPCEPFEPADPREPGERFPVDRPTAAFLAIAASAPNDFDDGVIIVLLDHEARPAVAVAVDGAPEHDLGAVCDLVARVKLLPEAAPVVACVLGVHRTSDSTDEQAVAVGPAVLAAWADATRRLRDCGVELRDVLVVEQTRWMSAWENAGFGECY